MTRSLPFAAFFVGLAAVFWVGAGYIGTNPLALAITVIIAAFYTMGALELWHYHQATATLARAVTDMPEAPASLGQWLAPLHPSLQNAVRLRIEGERVGLPGPALAPYLAGLLVLLGMLGTFLGMVVTLNGTGAALDSATSLDAIRASLSAPVKGLGLAFGTSVAGVAASAMLGLISSLCRRDRLQAAQLLDTRIATTLRGFSQAHRREASFKLLQQQAEVMPQLVDSLQAMMATMERQSQALNERLLASQESFHGKAEAAYAGLASSVDRSLKDSLTEGARVAGATIQPVVEATMAGIARQTAALHNTIELGVQRQLDGVASRMEASTTNVADIWKAALTSHQQTSTALYADLRGVMDHFSQTFAQRSSALVDSVSARLAHTVGSVSDTWGTALAQHQRASEQLSGDTQQALVAAAATFEQHAASLLHTVGQAHSDLQTQMASRDEQRLAGWTQALGTMATSLQHEWQQAGAHTAGQHQAIAETLVQQQRASAQLSGDTQQALAAAAATFEQHAAALLGTVAQAHGDLQTQMASRDEQRLAAWTQALQAMAASLQQEWQQTGANTASQQREICTTLAETARDMSAQSEAHAKNTIAEISQLVQAAAEAPRAAAEVMTELRQKLSDSMARDNTMLEERSRILGTLETLLNAVNHASTEQRTAIDALVGASAELLERVGTRFADQVGTEAGKMADVTAQLTGSAVEVASLGESFGTAVQLFSQSNDKLGAQLQRIEGALSKSLARSDEQLAYYVAQAREVIDLSILSQKQIVEDLQHLASQRAAEGSAA